MPVLMDAIAIVEQAPGQPRRNQHQPMDDERQDQEVDDRGNELAVAEHRDAGRLQRGIAVRIAFERRRNRSQPEEVVRKVESAENCADDRHDQVIGQRSDDAAERGTDDHRDRQIEDIAARDEFTKTGHACLPFSDGRTIA
jgi:hypothetical protein